MKPNSSLTGFTRRDFLKLLSIAGGALWLARCGRAPTAAIPATATAAAAPAESSKTPSSAPPSETATALPAPGETFTPVPLSPPEYLPPADGSYASFSLPEPQLPDGVSLMQALQERRSRREFRPDELPLAFLSAILWAGFGVNRPDGKRTAPSAYNVQDIDIYLATPKGVFRYDARGHGLIPLLPDDLRPFTGSQAFVAAAPLDLVYVSDYSRIDASDEDRLQWSWAHTGCIAQNVYLACAALGLAVVVRSSINRQSLAGRMGLSAHQHITLAQTIGYPA